MHARTRRHAGALLIRIADSFGSKGLALCIIAVAVVAAQPLVSQHQVQIDARLAASSGWLDRFNAWRTSTGLTALTENTTWSQGDYNHALYMVKNDLVTHYETVGTPYYTTAGDVAAQNSNIYVSSSTGTSDDQAIDWWMGAPFHAMGMMDPRLTSTGFGSYREVKSGWQLGAAVDTIRGNSFSGGAYPVYFPGNGTTEPLTSYSGNEFPDPLQACPGYSAPTGLPVFVEVGGNVNTTVGLVHSFTGNGVALNHCVIDSSNAAVGSYLYTRGGVILIPQQPLQAGVKYVVALTVNGLPYTWSFTVGPFVACTSVSATTTPASQAAAGTAVTITASAAGCTNPQFEFWMRNANAACCQLSRPYSTNATFIWNTTGLSGGTYYFSVWAQDTRSQGVYSNSFGRYDAAVVLTYTLSNTCSSVAGSGAPTSPRPLGTPVTISGAATGCTSPLYEFFMLYPGSQTWQLVQPYSPGAGYSWSTSGKPAGTYSFSIWARDASGPGANITTLGRWDAYAMLQYQMTVSPCSGVTASGLPAGSAPAGTAVAITAMATGCMNPQYEFFVLYPGSQTWLLARGYSSSPTYSWSTGGKPKGTYQYSVWARDASSPGANSTPLGTWDAYTMLPYTLT